MLPVLAHHFYNPPLTTIAHYRSLGNLFGNHNSHSRILKVALVVLNIQRVRIYAAATLVCFVEVGRRPQTIDPRDHN